MNSSVQSSRRIASNRLWTPAGVVCDPLVEVAPDGGILSVERCPDPDRLPFTEFHAGMLVPGFPADYRAAFAWLLARRENSLAELLPQLLSGAFAPAGPASPFAPASTAGPAGTTSPAGAASPFAPASTAFPANTASPASPAGAASPFAPASTAFPADTASPASPAGAASPADPPTPPVPTFPTGLTTPSTPVIPAAPAAPAAPTAPTAPAAPGSCLVVLSGLDYDLLRLTAQSQIRLLARS